MRSWTLRSTAIRAAGVLGVAALYVAGAKLGLSFASTNRNVTAVWPPTGIAVAALLRLGAGVWPGIAAGALVANLLNGAPAQTAVLIAFGNTAAPLVAMLLLTRMVRIDSSLQRPADVVALVFGGGFASMLLSATCGTAALALTGQLSGAQPASVWVVWWVGDAMGVVLVAPILLTVGRGPLRESAFVRRPVEWGILVVATAVATRAIFAVDVPLAFLIFPLLVWAAMRFKQAGAAAAGLLTSGVATWATVTGHGEFSQVSPTAGILTLQTFNLAAAVTTLLLAAVTSEREGARAALQHFASGLENRVRERTSQLEEAQAITHIGSWNWDVVSDVVTWSAELYRIFGVTPESFRPTYAGFLDLLPRDDRARIDGVVRQAFRTGEPFEFQHAIFRPSGELRWVHGRGVVGMHDGRTVKMHGTSQDVTGSKEVENALREAVRRERAATQLERDAADRLRGIDAMKDSLLVAVSHDLRTPLTVVLGIAATLQRDELRPADTRSAALIARLHVHAKRLEKLLLDLLDVDRLGRGILEPHPRVTELRALAMRVVESIDTGGRPIAVAMDESTVFVDTSQVERIVESLVTNALRHTVPPARIWVRSRREAAGTVLSVEDEGPGVPDDLKVAVFEPFRRGDTPTHSPGTGIGLSLVARFAELHGGRAWVEDRPDGGSAFHVLLPDDHGLHIGMRPADEPRAVARITPALDRPSA